MTHESRDLKDASIEAPGWHKAQELTKLTVLLAVLCVFTFLFLQGKITNGIERGHISAFFAYYLPLNLGLLLGSVVLKLWMNVRDGAELNSRQIGLAFGIGALTLFSLTQASDARNRVAMKSNWQDTASIKPMLRHRDPRVRALAVEVLSTRCAHEKDQTLFKDIAARDRSALVQDQLNRVSNIDERFCN